MSYISGLTDLALAESSRSVKKDEDSYMNQFQCGIEVNSAIAIYRVEYNYNPMFNYFLSDDQLLVRESIVIQEYERDEFKL
ncbi:hypothetical protein ACPSKX_09790 [Moritella viscosa]